jgi:hypothetical protein
MPSKGNTTARGYGREHQLVRERLLRLHREGTECVRCGQPMYSWQRLQAGHAEIPASEGGKAERLEHAECNEEAGRLKAASLRVRAALPEW